MFWITSRCTWLLFKNKQKTTTRNTD